MSTVTSAHLVNQAASGATVALRAVLCRILHPPEQRRGPPAACGEEQADRGRRGEKPEGRVQ